MLRSPQGEGDSGGSTRKALSDQKAKARAGAGAKSSSRAHQVQPPRSSSWDYTRLQLVRPRCLSPSCRLTSSAGSTLCPPPLAVLVKAVAAAAEGCAAPFFVLSPERAAADHPYPHAPQVDPFRAAHLQHGLGRSFRLLLGPWPSALGPWSSAPLSRRGLNGAPGESTSSSGIPNGLLLSETIKNKRCPTLPRLR